jgi:hypothetical protein
MTMAEASTRARRARPVILLVIALAVVGLFVVVAARDDESPGAEPLVTTSAPTSLPTTVATTIAPTTAPTTSVAPTTTVAPNPGGDLVPVAPTRLLDTRTGAGTAANQAGKTSLATVSIAGRTGSTSPAQVKAVALHVTVAEPNRPGYLTISAAGSQPSLVSQIAFVDATASSLIVTRAGADGGVEVRLSDGASSHVIVDLFGYFTTARSPDNLSIVAEPQPVAMIDSRGGAPLDAAKTIDITLPPPQSGAVLGITATGARGTGYLTVFGGASRPETSTVNFGVGHDATGLAIVPTPSDRIVHVYNGSSAPVHVVVFQIARLVRGAPADGLALNIEGTVAQDGRSAPFPFRTVDTRGTATCMNTVGGGVSSIGSIFPKAKALLVSITVVNASIASYLTAYTGSTQPPGMATLNFDARDVRTNLAFVPVAGDHVNLVCGGGNPEYILDVLATLE